MRELLVDTCTGEEEDGTAHSFQYYILVDEMDGMTSTAVKDVWRRAAASKYPFRHDTRVTRRF